MKKIMFSFLAVMLISSLTFAVTYYPMADGAPTFSYLKIPGVSDGQPVPVSNGDNLDMTFGLTLPKVIKALNVRMYLYVFGTIVEISKPEMVYTNALLPISSYQSFEAYVMHQFDTPISGGVPALLTVVFEDETGFILCGGNIPIMIN